MNDTFMKEKPIFPLLTSMALPMVVSMLVNALYNIVDSLFVARISEEAMTALSLVYPVQNLINAIAIGFSIGIAALISLHLGAGNKEKADMAATHGMVLSLIHGVVISIVCTAIMPQFLRSFTSDETVIAMGVTYSRVAFMFAVVIMAAGTVLCLALSGQLIGLFSSNAETIAIGTSALRVICVGFIVSTLSVVASGSLEGLGMGVQSLVISLCRYIVVIMPLAWLFCRLLGADGIWNAFWVTEVITAGISMVVYHKSVKLK